MGHTILPFAVHRSLFKYLFLFALILLAANCKRKPSGAEGKIRFRITYEQSRVGGYSSTVLPKEMIMEFSNDMVRNTIEGGLGFFSLVNVSDLRNHQNTTWLKFIDKKYIYFGEKKESPCCFGILDGMQLSFTDSIKDIAGLECMQAIASFPGNGIEPFNIWYTTELGLSNPNSNSPFREIPGVLLEFSTLMGNANMHMVATGFGPQHIPQKVFQPPKNFRPVSKDEMDRILNALMK
jgi:GLPGLI family protein